MVNGLTDPASITPSTSNSVPMSRLLATGDGDAMLTIIDVATGKPSSDVESQQLFPARSNETLMVQASF